ncbi:Gfo/Idh/MocA family oxidoreductase [bacterium]|nr:Gfo/Idh/MocA family oxidoreductase [bacterium]
MNYKVCVVGAGRWGKNHIKTLIGLEALGGVVEANPRTCSELQSVYPDLRIFETLDEALKHGFDGYTVATPAETHFELAFKIITAGHHVMVEKPITLTAADAHTLKNLADEKGVNLMVGHVLLFHPAILKIKELLGSGKIGKLQYIYSNRLNLGTVRTEENILWSFAPHDIAIFQYLIEDRPMSVTSRGGAFVQPHIHDSTMTILEYPDNIVGHIFVSWLHPFKEQRLVIIGSKGMLSFEDSTKEKELLFYEKGIDWIQGAPVKRDGPSDVIPYHGDAPLTAELRYFVEHLDGRPIEIANSRNAVDVLEILEKASEEL